MAHGYGYHGYNQPDLAPIETRGLRKGMKVFFRANGDPFAPPKQFVINPWDIKNLEILKEELTQRVCKNGYARHIHTPAGRDRVKNIEDLRENETYYVGPFPFVKQVGYQNIGEQERSRRRQRRDLSPDYVNPRYKDILGRAQDQAKTVHGKRVHCYRNGDDINASKVVLLDTQCQHDWGCFANEISDKMRIRAENFFHLNGIPVRDPDEIAHEGCVVVTANKKEKFKHANYGDARRNFSTGSPRPTFGPVDSPRNTGSLNRSYPVVPPIKKGGPNTHTSSPESYPASQYGRGKRSYENTPNNRQRRARPARQVDYDKDQGGVYKSKTRGREAAGAQQVKDTQETKTDLPIDQMEAEEVKEELNTPRPTKQGEKETPIPNDVELTKPPSQEIKNGKAESSSQEENIRDTQRGQ